MQQNDCLLCKDGKTGFVTYYLQDKLNSVYIPINWTTFCFHWEFKFVRVLQYIFKLTDIVITWKLVMSPSLTVFIKSCM